MKLTLNSLNFEHVRLEKVMSEVHVLATITPAPGKEARVCTSTFAPHQLYARRLTFLTAQGTPH